MKNVGYRINYLTDTFAVGVTIGDMYLEYVGGDREHLYGLSFYLGIVAFRAGWIKQTIEI